MDLLLQQHQQDVAYLTKLLKKEAFLWQIVICILFLTAFLANSAVWAKSNPALYQVTVSVADRTQGNRIKAMQEALRLVIVKLSGRQSTLTKPAIEAALQHAEQYVTQYQYSHNKQSNTTHPFQLLLNFNIASIEQLFERANERIWVSDSRPKLMVWVVQETENRTKQVLSDASESSLIVAIKQQFHLRGVPLILPIMDLEDIEQINPIDLWEGFDSRVIQASERYQPELIVTAKTWHENNQLKSQWRFINREYDMDLVINRTDSTELGRAAADKLISVLATPTKLKGRLSESRALKISVSNINALSDYTLVQQYLESLSSIDSIKTESVLSEEVVFSVVVKNNVEQFKQTLAKDNRLVPDSSGASFIDKSDNWLYRWAQQ